MLPSRAPRPLVLAVLVLLALGLGLLALRSRHPAAGEAPAKEAPAGGVGAAAPAPSLRPAAPARQALALRLLPATLAQEPAAASGAFEGRVVSAETGAGVAGAELTFASDAGASSVRSGPDGHFRYVPPQPGDYQLATVTAQGFVPFAPEWGQSPVRLTAVAGQRVDDILLALTPQLSLLGRVLSPEGAPVAGAQVRLLTDRAGESVLHPVADRFVSDEQGEFRVLAAEGATLEARHPDYAAGRAVIGTVVKHARRVDVRLGARRTAADGGAEGLALAGVVVDAGGQPVAGARVDARSSAQRFPQRYGDELGYQAAADEQGRFVLEGLPQGYYDVAAQLSGLTPARLKDVVTGRTDLRLVLTEGATLSGRVRDAVSGEPLPSFTVVVSQRVGALQREPVAELTVLDPGGRYRVAGLPAGRHEVEVVAAGHAPGEAQVEVPDAPRAAVVADFRLEPGARLYGTVVSSGSGKPVAGARVSLETGRGGGALSVQLDGRTDAQGAFTLEGLAPGEATLVASADAHHTRILSGVPVGGAAGARPLRIELTPTKPGEEPSVELVGIGAVLAARGDMLVVGEVVAGGGGAEVGLVPGDGILSIDGQRVAELGFTEAIQRIRGPEGSRVVLGVRRGAGLAADGGTGPVAELAVPRRRIVR
ncbi:MAG TPA: carboxypeptidase regulatory-like domain-containing protein [Aggregicoccus sp.]|nr:carboxypeptidase regulatory-like domain-containing protein [Aggregicoccus sp.]